MFSPSHHPLERYWDAGRARSWRRTRLTRGPASGGGWRFVTPTRHIYIYIYARGGSSGHLLSSRFTYLQEKSWKVGHEV